MPPPYMRLPPSNNVTLTVSASTTSPCVSSQDDRERSRNAKAQARHRAKRKAYIEQLEQTVTRLQAAMSLADEDVGSLNRIRELEEENTCLRQEIIELRRELEDRSAKFLRPDVGCRTSDLSPNNSYRADSNGANPPPPLHIPALQYSNSSRQQQQQPREFHPQQNGSLTYPVTGPTSTSSSPTYSSHHLSPTVSRSSGGQQHHNALPSINDHCTQVKVEDDDFLHAPTISQQHQYLYTPNEPVSVGGNPWHAYPSDRPDIRQ